MILQACFDFYAEEKILVKSSPVKHQGITATITRTGTIKKYTAAEDAVVEAYEFFLKLSI